MSSIADLVVSLSADSASFRDSMNEANQSLERLKQQSSDAGGALQSLQQAFEGLVSVEALRRVADFGATLVESAAHIGHLSEALGVSAGAYQALAYAAQQAGVPAEGFAGVMEKLSKNSRDDGDAGQLAGKGICGPRPFGDESRWQRALGRGYASRPGD